MAEVTAIYVNKNKYGWSGADNRETVEYTVKVDSTDAVAQDILALSELPKVGDSLPENVSLVVQTGGITADREDTKSQIWRVHVEYTLISSAFSLRNVDVPRLRQFSFSSKIYSRVAKKCYERYIEGDSDTGALWVYIDPKIDAKKDKQIIDTAGSEFAAGSVNEEYSQLVITWTQEEYKSFLYADVMNYIGAINIKDTTILGIKFKPKQVLIRDITPIPGHDEDGNGVWLCTYTVEIAETDWDLAVLNAGVRAVKHKLDAPFSSEHYASYNIRQYDVYKQFDLTDDEIKKSPALDDYNDFISDPWPLDKIGEMLEKPNSGAPVKYPVYVKFRTRKMIDFDASLDLISDEIVPLDATGV